MTLSLPIHPTDAACADDARAARAERRLRALAELAEIGMDIARGLQRQARDEEAAADALGLAFARVSRAVRQTLALEDKLDRPPEAPALTPAVWLADLRASPGIEHLRVAIHRDEVRGRVAETIETERSDAAETERLLADLEERLDDCEAEDDFLDRPIGEIIASICRDLGVTPDWSLWRDEDWAIDEAERKPPGSPYADRKRPSGLRSETAWPPDTNPPP